MSDKRILIKVTKADIKQKHCHRANKLGNCPISIAILRKIPEANKVRTTYFYTNICLSTDKNQINCKLPRSARRFITTFDNNNKKAKPFNFYLQVPIAYVL